MIRFSGYCFWMNSKGGTRSLSALTSTMVSVASSTQSAIILTEIFTSVFHFLSFAKKSLAEFHHVNPIIVTSLRFVALSATKTIVEVESVNVECYALCHITDVCIIKKPSSDGHVHSRKNGGALIICCKDSVFLESTNIFEDFL